MFNILKRHVKLSIQEFHPQFFLNQCKIFTVFFGGRNITVFFCGKNISPFITGNMFTLEYFACLVFSIFKRKSPEEVSSALLGAKRSCSALAGLLKLKNVQKQIVKSADIFNHFNHLNVINSFDIFHLMRNYLIKYCENANNLYFSPGFQHSSNCILA